MTHYAKGRLGLAAREPVAPETRKDAQRSLGRLSRRAIEIG
jgi:hypothetical protein